MRHRSFSFPPGTLWQRVLERTEEARRCGAILSIPTISEIIEQCGVKFLVRLARALAAKEQAKATEQQTDPFLPYNDRLFVADLSDTHLCLLNKFNVVDYHLLIVTLAFEEQESLLAPADFEALLLSMAEIDGLGFYNAGQVAGASQRHKHLQLVPLPLAVTGPAIPIEPLLAGVTYRNGIGTSATLPFVHALGKIDAGSFARPADCASRAEQQYRALLQAVGLPEQQPATGRTVTGPYNLLLTREWMLLVPRSKECFGSISINALGFAGALLVKNEDQMRVLKERGPMTALKEVAVTEPTFLRLGSESS